MKITGAQLIVKLLENQGITTIAGIPGGAVLPLYDALSRSEKITHILAKHEQGAAFIAHGQARSSGKTAVCFGTSGPGATNLLTAIADAKMDSIPMIAITGQVQTYMIGTDAFQEVDIYGMTIPITKHNFLIKEIGELLTVIPEAFRLANSGRPGPILIDIPKDIQKEIIEIDVFPEIIPLEYSDNSTINDIVIDHAYEMIAQAQRPLFYIGGGVINSKNPHLIEALSEKMDIPMITTFMGKGAIRADHPNYLGMLGAHGWKRTNEAVNASDLLIILGARLDDRATGKLEEFAPDAKIIHVDIDASEHHKIKQATIAIKSSVDTFLEAISPLCISCKRDNWRDEIERFTIQNPIPTCSDTHTGKGVVAKVSSLIEKDSIVTTDVGQHQMWAAQYLERFLPRTFLSSGGLGTMGFGLPAAIGAAIENPEKRIHCITGDGSFLMNIQELATMSELQLDITILLLNNSALGLVRQQQELFFNKNYFASQFETKMDFAMIARGFGIPSITVERSEIAIVLENDLTKRGPKLINMIIPQEDNVLPMVIPGKSNTEMVEA